MHREFRWLRQLSLQRPRIIDVFEALQIMGGTMRLKQAFRLT
jgi:hypothetical protein